MPAYPKVGDLVEFVVDYHAGGVQAGYTGRVEAIEPQNTRGGPLARVTGVRNRAYVSRLKVVEKTMDNLEVGDVLEYKGTYIEDYERKVVAVVDNYVITEDSDDQSLNAYTKDQLKEEKWVLKTEPVEMTVAEIAEKLGHDVKVVK